MNRNLRMTIIMHLIALLVLMGKQNSCLATVVQLIVGSVYIRHFLPVLALPSFLNQKCLEFKFLVNFFCRVVFPRKFYLLVGLIFVFLHLS